MSYIQFRDEKEMDKHFDGKRVGFVSDDWRVYDKIRFADTACYHDLNAEEIDALLALKDNIEMVGNDGFEQSFLDLEESAKLLTDAYRKVASILKRKPKEPSCTP